MLSAKAVERLGIRDEYPPARRFVRRPRREQIEEQRVVDRVALLAWMRPVAAPHEALGRSRDERLRDLRGIRIRRRSDLAVEVRPGKLHPRTVLVDQCAYHVECRVCRAEWRLELREVIEHDLRRQTAKERRMFDDLLARHVELEVPPVSGDAPRERLDHVD